MNRAIKYLLFILAIISMGCFVNIADAQQYKARADFSACSRQFIPQTSGEDKVLYDSKEACQSRIDEVQSSSYLGCATYECDPVGGDSGSNSGTSSSGDLVNESSQLVVGGLMHNDGQALGLGLMGLGVNMMLQGSQTSPQQEAQQQAQAAAQAAEQERQAAELAKQRELIKEQLLGEAPSGGDSSGGLHLMGVTPEASLQLMTGDQALAPMTSSVNQTAPKTPTFGKKKVKHSHAFNKGYHDGSQCYSQNAGPYCNGLTGQTWQTCLADYRAGYEVGTKEEKMKIDEATTLGRLDREAGKPNKGLDIADNGGDCRNELDEAYTNGYGQVSRAKANPHGQ